MEVLGHLHKIVLGGVLAETESWSMSMHFLKANPGKIIVTGAIATAANAWFSNGYAKINASAKLDFIKINELDPLPRINPPNPKTGLPRPASPAYTRYLLNEPPNELFLTPGTSPAAGSLNGPPQLTLAITLATDSPRGLAHRGRVYPPTVFDCGTDGRAPANLTFCRDAFKDLLVAINAAGGGNVVVYSGVRGTQVNVVTGVKLGRVVDTQRRRRRNLQEEYIYAPLV